jgi:hypothetical protein
MRGACFLWSLDVGLVEEWRREGLKKVRADSSRRQIRQDRYWRTDRSSREKVRRRPEIVKLS